jgi:hypothetical protein
MATNDLIAELVRDLRPVHPLPLPQVRATQWALMSAAIVAAVTTAIGLRADLIAAATAPPFQMHVLLLLIAAIGSAAAALASAVPGEPTTLWRRIAAPLAVFGWCLWLSGEVWGFAAAGEAWWPIAAGWGCVAKTVAIGLVPGALLFVMIAKADPADLQRTSVFAALASAAIGAIGAEVTCPLTNPMHLLLWHAGPVVATVAVVVLATTLATRGFAGLRHRT